MSITAPRQRRNSFPETFVFPKDKRYSDTIIIVSSWIFRILYFLAYASLLSIPILAITIGNWHDNTNMVLIAAILISAFLALLMIAYVISIPHRITINKSYIEYVGAVRKRFLVRDLDLDKCEVVSYQNYMPYSRREKDGWWFVETVKTISKYSRAFVLFESKNQQAVLLKFQENRRRPVVLSVAGVLMSKILAYLRDNSQDNNNSNTGGHV